MVFIVDVEIGQYRASIVSCIGVQFRECAVPFVHFSLVYGGTYKNDRPASIVRSS